MFEFFHALMLNFLELTFIFIALLVCLQQRRSIGTAPFFMSLGFLLILSHLLNAAEICGVFSNTLHFRVLKSVVSADSTTAAYLREEASFSLKLYKYYIIKSDPCQD